MSRGRLRAYVRYQLVDYLMQRASIALILVLFVTGLPLFGALHGNPTFFSTQQGPMLAKQLFTSTVALFLPLGAFLGSVGMVSGDRHNGYVRFYFSKPVNVVRFYVQAYLVNGLTFVLLFGLLTWVYGAITIHQPVGPAMAAAALTFVLVGGLGLLGSTLTRFDGAVVALIYVISMALQQVVSMPVPKPLPTWLTWLASVLPPVQKLDQVRDQLYAAQPLVSGSLWHVLAYGLGAFMLGLVALRRLPLSR